MKARVILNPYAGRWMALRRRDDAIAALHAAGVEHDLQVTAYPRHAIELARQACLEGCEPIITAGGDGSISEVINGVLQAVEEAGSRQIPSIGILPLGSANDLVDNLGLPRDLLESSRIIAAGHTRSMDIGLIRWGEDGAKVYFDNNAAVGLEPYITLIQQRIQRVHGDLRYLVATLRGILDNPCWQMRLEWEGGEYEGPITLVTVGNHRRTGGLFYVAPHANGFDGLLTFVYGFIKGRLQTLRVLPRLMKPDIGNYVEHPAVFEHHSPWLRISSKADTPLHADGEIQSPAERLIEYSVLPSLLPVLLPETQEK